MTLPQDCITTFTNPIAMSGGDPWVVADPLGNGYYYCSSAYGGITVEHMASPNMITTHGSVVFDRSEGGKINDSWDWWAPELHYIRGNWYIYMTVNGVNKAMHRVFVFRGTSQDPTKPFDFIGEVTDPDNLWAIDGGVLQYGGQLYFIWSGAEDKDGNGPQNIYIAHMSDPMTIDGRRVMLSKAEYDWELVTRPPDGPIVNEGPEALYKGSTVHIVYSASFCDMDAYCLGLLTFRGGDILNPKNWIKARKPVFSSADKAYGPGHCSFVRTPDGQYWVIYHCTLNTGEGIRGRTIRMQPFTWINDMPNFGKPAPCGEVFTVNYKAPAAKYNAMADALGLNLP